MTAEVIEARPWSWRRWWLLLVLLCTGQFGLICWLSDRTPPRVHLPARVPALHMSGNASAESLELSDPTLFVLPHRQGFSGPAWLTITPHDFHPPEPPDPLHCLALPVDQLGADFQRFMATNQFDGTPGRAEPRTELSLPYLPQVAAVPGRSTMRVEGELASRRLLTPLTLPSWTNADLNADLLPNTVVQLLVGADGRTLSATLLWDLGAGPSPITGTSGLAEADNFALDLARAARFESVSTSGPARPTDPLSGISKGRMIFEWHTIPTPATNAVPGP